MFFRKIKKITNRRGFTLVEMIIALGIFSVATTYAVSIFVQSNQVQRRTANLERLMADARYTLEVMAREVRLGLVDYQYYQDQDISLDTMPLTQDGAVLAIRDADDNQILFRRQLAGSARWVVQVYVAGQWLDITPEDLSVERLSFYISPPANPFVWETDSADYPSDQQPLVTIILESKSLHPDLQTEKISHLQTTVTTRKYVR